MLSGSALWLAYARVMPWFRDIKLPEMQILRGGEVIRIVIRELGVELHIGNAAFAIEGRNAKGHG
jgi:hypothetical protein